MNPSGFALSRAVLTLLVLPGMLHAGSETLVYHSSFITHPNGVSGNTPAATVTQGGPSERSFNGFNDFSIVRLKASSGISRVFVKAQAFRTISPQESSYASVSGLSIWQDLVTINAPGRTGQSGTFTGSVRVGGSIVTNNVVGFYNGANAAVSVFYGFESETPLTRDTGRASGGRSVASLGAAAGSSTTEYSGEILPFTVNFTYGTPFHIGVRVDGSATTDGSPFGTNGNSISPPGGAGTGSATVDFGNTVTWEGISSVLDNASQPVASYTISSVSGTDYRFAVREPAREIPLLGFVDAGPGEKTLTWASINGTSYQLQSTSDLNDPEAWQDLGSAIPATTTETSVTFDFPITATPRFWRIKEIPAP